MWRISSISASLDVAGVSTNYRIMKVYTAICLSISIITTIELFMAFYINEQRKNDEADDKVWYKSGIAQTAMGLTQDCLITAIQLMMLKLVNNSV